MGNYGTVRPMTLGQIRDLISALVQATPLDLTLEQAQWWIGHKAELAKNLEFLCNPFARVMTQISDTYKQVVLRGVNALVKEWVKFYKEVFNLDADFSNLAIPAKRDSFNWLVIMLQSLTAQKLYDKCKELFHAWKWTDKSLDDVLDQAKSSRNPANGVYAIWLRDRVEADEELKNKSANDLQQTNFQGIALEERLLLELFYYWKTKKHLDIQNWTLCSGSRYYDGNVPHVHWNSISDKLNVDWTSPDDAYVYLRAREVVS